MWAQFWLYILRFKWKSLLFRLGERRMQDDFSLSYWKLDLTWLKYIKLIILLDLCRFDWMIKMTLKGWRSGHHVNLMKFNKVKWKAQHLGWGNAKYQYSLGGEGSWCSPAEKKLGTVVNENLDMNMHACSPKSQLNPELHAKNYD